MAQVKENLRHQLVAHNPREKNIYREMLERKNWPNISRNMAGLDESGVFSLLAIFLLGKLIQRLPASVCDRYLFRPAPMTAQTSKEVA